MSPVIPHFHLDEEPSGDGVHTINVSGEIHVSTAPQLWQHLQSIIESGKTTLLLDLSAVEFIDSTGLSVLLNGLRLITQRGGRMAVVCVNPTVLRLFQITRLDSTFEIFEDREAAIAHIAQPAGGNSGVAP